MKKLLVLKSGKAKDGDFWALLELEINGRNHHAVIYTTVLQNANEEMEFSQSYLWKMVWQLAGSSNTYLNGTVRKSGFDKNTILNFGLYKNYEVGIVYAFDFKYLEWCIFNIDEFYINDIEELMDIGVYRDSQEYQDARDMQFPEYYKFIVEFKSIQQLDKTLGILNPQFRFSFDAVRLNNRKWTQ